MPESGTYGSLRRASSNGRPYRNPRPIPAVRFAPKRPLVCGDSASSCWRSMSKISTPCIPCLLAVRAALVRANGHI